MGDGPKEVLASWQESPETVMIQVKNTSTICYTVADISRRRHIFSRLFHSGYVLPCT